MSSGQKKDGKKVSRGRKWLFPSAIAGVYLLGLIFVPEKTGHAFEKGLSILWHITGPISLALVIMVLLNRFLPPALAARYMGANSGIKTVLFSSLAGILSMGPVYAWYPLLKTLRDKGISSFHIANFMACRSIKPVLIPVLISYFGWRFSTFFLLASLIGSFGVAAIVYLASRYLPDTQNTGL